MLKEIGRSIENARQVAASGLNRIRVSAIDEASIIWLPRTRIECRKSWPDIAVQILEISSSDKHLQKLINRHADVAFIRQSTNNDYIISELLYQQPIVVVNKNSQLAKAKVLRVSGIAKENIIGYPKHARPILHDIICSIFRAKNIRPKVISEFIDKSTLMQFVAQNLGIGLAPQWIKNISPGGLAFIPSMPEDTSIDMYIACRKYGNSPTTNEFISASKEAALHMIDPHQ